MSEEIITEKSFLQIKSIRTSSNAFIMKLKEGDVIIALDGEMIHKSYEELSELKNFKKISFEFSEISTYNNKDILVSNIFLTSGNKIAY